MLIWGQHSQLQSDGIISSEELEAVRLKLALHERTIEIDETKKKRKMKLLLLVLILTF